MAGSSSTLSSSPLSWSLGRTCSAPQQSPVCLLYTSSRSGSVIVRSRIGSPCSAPVSYTHLPSTKAEIGDHDENISYEQSIAHLEKYFPGKGEEYAAKLRDYTLALYKKCADYALSRGIIIADTKFEFGLDKDGNIVLGDEMLTPDSSRFWPADGYEPVSYTHLYEPSYQYRAAIQLLHGSADQRDVRHIRF